MKQFIKHLILFLLPLLILSFVVDKVLNNTLKKSKTGDYKVWNDLLNGSVNSDIVIYGSSRAWYHLNPKIFEDSTGLNTYNLGVDGHNFYMQNLRHELLLKYNKQPKIIILSLDNFTLNKKKDLYNPEQFLPYLKNKEILKATKTYFGFDYFDYQLPLIRYAGQIGPLKNALKIIVKPSLNKTDRYKGFSGQNLEWNNDLDKALLLQKNYVQLFDSATVILFDEFLKNVKDKKIEVIMVYSPEYIEGQKFVSNRNELFSIYHKFSAKYNIPFFDYSDDSLSYDKKYFYNSQHLNGKAADIFTIKLLNDIKKLSNSYLNSSSVK